MSARRDGTTIHYIIEPAGDCQWLVFRDEALIARRESRDDAIALVEHLMQCETRRGRAVSGHWPAQTTAALCAPHSG